MGMILHDWNLEKKMQLIRAAYEALSPEALSSSLKRSSTTPGAKMSSGY